MVPIRFLFRSRWAALAWAGGICLTAVNVANEHKHEAKGADKSGENADVNFAQVSAAMADGSK